MIAQCLKLADEDVGWWADAPSTCSFSQYCKSLNWVSNGMDNYNSMEHASHHCIGAGSFFIEVLRSAILLLIIRFAHLTFKLKWSVKNKVIKKWLKSSIWIFSTKKQIKILRITRSSFVPAHATLQQFAPILATKHSAQRDYWQTCQQCLTMFGMDSTILGECLH